MSGYVAGGYLVALGTLSTYAITLVRREQIARRRAKGTLSRDEQTSNAGGER